MSVVAFAESLKTPTISTRRDFAKTETHQHSPRKSSISPMSAQFTPESSPINKQITDERLRFRERVLAQRREKKINQGMIEEYRKMQKDVKDTEQEILTTAQDIETKMKEFTKLKEERRKQRKQEKLICQLQRQAASLSEERKALEEQKKQRASVEEAKAKNESNSAIESMQLQKAELQKDIASFSSAIEALKPTQPMSQTPTKSRRSEFESLQQKLSTVNREIRDLTSKCRSLREFVSVRSPVRYREIALAEEEEEKNAVIQQKSPAKRRKTLF